MEIMKKIVLLFALVLGFCFTTNAQSKLSTEETKELNYKERAFEDVVLLNKIVTLSPQVKKDLFTLMEDRTEALENSKNIEEIKALYEKFGEKMMSALSPDQIEKLKSNQELYLRLTTYTVIK